MVAYEIIFGIVLIVLAIAIVALVLLQEGNSKGLSGAIAGGLGSCIADIILGYSLYAPATLIIKALMGFVPSAKKNVRALDSEWQWGTKLVNFNGFETISAAFSNSSSPPSTSSSRISLLSSSS